MLFSDEHPSESPEHQPGTPDAAGEPLLPRHLEDLRRSGLTDDTVHACGFHSCSDPAQIRDLLRWKGSAQRLGPCLVIPFVAADGSPTGYARVKPDQPQSTPNGKSRKYESPKGLPNRAFFPPRTRAVLADPASDLIVTEGEKKAAAADQNGFACVGLVGVYGWQQKRETTGAGRKAGQRELIDDLAAVAWQGRRVFVVFDSDAATNPNVRKAERHLAEVLRAAGATVTVVRLPPGTDGGKQGIDDFLLAQGTEALRELLVEPASPDDDDPGALFRNEAELDRLAALKLDDPALFEAEKITLKARGVPMRALDAALAPRIARLRAERRAAAQDEGPGRCPYSVRGGVTFRTVATNEGEIEVPLCNFAAAITAVVARDDGAETRRLFTLEGRTAAGVPLPPAAVPADQFAAMNWVTGAWGNRTVVYAGQGTKDHLRAAIQILSGDVPERTVYAHLGWRQVQGTWVFLHAGGALGSKDTTLEVAVDGALVGFLLPEPPESAALRKAVRAGLRSLDASAPLAPDRVLVPLLGAAYRAVLGGSDFGVHLFGRTGVFKSELAALAQQHFGATLDARNLPANWSSTANAIEITAFAAKDTLVVVDDFNPTGAADPQKLHATADRVFRGQGNRSGRDRLAADLSLRPPRPPRGLLLSTGEDIPRGHSLRARLPVVEVCPGDVEPSRLGACQRDAAGGEYARAMAGFVRWLATQYEAIRKRLGAERAAARESFAQNAPHARTPGAIGDLWLGWEYYTSFAVDGGAITVLDREKILLRVRAALTELAAAQADHLRAADPVEQFLRLVPAVLASGQAHLSALSSGPPAHAAVFGWHEVMGGGGIEWRGRGNQIGWLDGENVYLIPDAAFAEVQRVASAQREPLTTAPRTLWTRLHERGLLAGVDERGGKVRHTVRVSVAGQRVGCLQFTRSTLFPPTSREDTGATAPEAGSTGPSGTSKAEPDGQTEEPPVEPVGDPVGGDEAVTVDSTEFF